MIEFRYKYYKNGWISVHCNSYLLQLQKSLVSQEFLTIQKDERWSVFALTNIHLCIQKGSNKSKVTKDVCGVQMCELEAMGGPQPAFHKKTYVVVSYYNQLVIEISCVVLCCVVLCTLFCNIFLLLHLSNLLFYDLPLLSNSQF